MAAWRARDFAVMRLAAVDWRKRWRTSFRFKIANSDGSGENMLPGQQSRKAAS
jgi:hypothetical protein